ncbi:MAG: PAS domain-containing protein [Cyclobacteriaceae bacterium]
MPAYDIEIILSRQLADCLSIPIFIVDIKGNLVFYNEPAEEILGMRFDETGGMPVEKWSTIFKPLDETGNPMAPDDLPLVKTLKHGHPAHGTLWIESLVGDRHKISVTAYPLVGREGKNLGAVALFWTPKEQ